MSVEEIPEQAAPMPRTLSIALILALALAVACGDDTAPVPSPDDAEPEPEPEAQPEGVPEAQPEPEPQPEGSPEPEPEVNNAPGDPVLRIITTEGAVVGAFDGLAGVRSWRGIPYAAPPVGIGRWRAPGLPPVRDQALDATAPGPICPQAQAGSAGPGLVEDEDCLYLDVWAPPAEEGALPVMFWLHGGSFTSGSGSLGLYDGSSLARRGVVVVSINYRLGALGFLAHDGLIGEDPEQPGTGNYGLLDQIAALRWVRENVAAFGGDPRRVTIFGESAGAISACALMTSSLAEGLFSRVIMQSGFCALTIASTRELRGETPPAVDQGRRIAGRLGCEGVDDPLACMRAADVSALRAASVGAFGQPEVFEPSIDQHVLTTAPGLAIFQGESHDVPLLIGTNADEGTIFVTGARLRTEAQLVDAIRASFEPEIAERLIALYPASDYPSPQRALAAIFGDLVFVCPTRFAAARSAGHGRPTWLYHFTHETAFGRSRDLGVFHGSELAFVFGTLGSFIVPSRQEVALSLQIQALWTAFASQGAPADEGLVWEAFDPIADRGLELSADPAMLQGFRAPLCDFWEQILGLDDLEG